MFKIDFENAVEKMTVVVSLETRQGPTPAEGTGRRRRAGPRGQPDPGCDGTGVSEKGSSVANTPSLSCGLPRKAN